MKGWGPVHFLKEVRFFKGTGWVIFFLKRRGQAKSIREAEIWLILLTTYYCPSTPKEAVNGMRAGLSCLLCFPVWSQCLEEWTLLEKIQRRNEWNPGKQTDLSKTQERNPVPIAKLVLRALECDEIKVLDFLYTETSIDMIKIHNKPCIMRSIAPASFGPFINLTFT